MERGEAEAKAQPPAIGEAHARAKMGIRRAGPCQGTEHRRQRSRPERADAEVGLQAGELLRVPNPCLPGGCPLGR